MLGGGVNFLSTMKATKRKKTLTTEPNVGLETRITRIH